MPYQFSLPADALRIVLPHVGSEASRPNLHAVLMEPAGVLVATCGTTLAAVKVGPLPIAEPVALIFREARKVTARQVQSVEITVGDDGLAHVNILHASKYGALTVAAVTLADTCDAHGVALAHRFPHAWRTIVPVYHADTAPTTAISYAPEHIAKFGVKLSHAVDAAPIRLHFMGPERAAVVTWPTYPEAIGLIMPCRDETPDDTRTAFDRWQAFTA